METVIDERNGLVLRSVRNGWECVPLADPVSAPDGMGFGWKYK